MLAPSGSPQLTQDLATDSLRIADALQLESVLETLDAVRVRLGADSNNEFVVGHVSQFESVLVFLRNLDLDELVGDVDVDGLSCKEVTSAAGDDTADRLDQRARLNGSNAGRREKRGEAEVVLGADDGDVEGVGGQVLKNADSLRVLAEGPNLSATLTPQPPPRITRRGLSFMARFCSSSSSSMLTSIIGKFFGPPRRGCRLSGLTGTRPT